MVGVPPEGYWAITRCVHLVKWRNTQLTGAVTSDLLCLVSIIVQGVCFV